MNLNKLRYGALDSMPAALGTRFFRYKNPPPSASTAHDWKKKDDW